MTYLQGSRYHHCVFMPSPTQPSPKEGGLLDILTSPKEMGVLVTSVCPLKKFNHQLKKKENPL
jgi:hypothetical protein